MRNLVKFCELVNKVKDKNKDKKPTILIVEDEVANNKMIKEMLELENYDTIQAFTGQEVLNYFDSNNPNPDLVLLDLMLPDISGFEICRRLKMSRETNIVPVIMLTALTDLKSHISGIMVGANQYLGKPFTTEQLLNEIDSLLEWKNNLLAERKHFEQITFALNSEIKYMDQLNNMIANILKRTNIDEEEIEEIKSGIYEIGVNAIEWGNRFNKDLIVTVNYEITDQYLKIVVEDEGTGFNFRSYLNGKYKGIDHQEKRLNEGKRLGGFGISMAKLYFDEIKYNEKGNKVSLYKHLK